MKKLLPEQNDFFKQIVDLAFVNPFGKEREAADCRLLNSAPNILDLSQRSEKIQALLRDRLQQLQPLSVFRITDYQDKTREIIEYAWLFYQFHEFQDRFNQFIVDQEQMGDEALELPFADELIGCFQSAGFNETECAKYSALF